MYKSKFAGHIKFRRGFSFLGQLHFHCVVHGGNETSYVIVEIFSSSSATKTLTLEINKLLDKNFVYLKFTKIS